jgi:5-methylcytosine-specific restriction endonuclease McrA
MEKPKLTIELIPSTAWGKNVRNEVPPKEWDEIRMAIYTKADFQCEVCGSTDGGLECHEIWAYQEHFHVEDESVRHVQKLTGLVCLCRKCHLVKHFGRATITGREQQAREHLRKVNGWNAQQAEAHIRESLLVWNARCKVPWELDISYIRSTKVTL